MIISHRVYINPEIIVSNPPRLIHRVAIPGGAEWSNEMAENGHYA